MTRRQSRRRQRQLERELFGPEPRGLRPGRARAPVLPLPPPAQVPGDCAFCGNCCFPVEEWTCFHCGVVYPPCSS